VADVPSGLSLTSSEELKKKERKKERHESDGGEKERCASYNRKEILSAIIAFFLPVMK
jgi:hypothetical protein